MRKSVIVAGVAAAGVCVAAIAGALEISDFGAVQAPRTGSVDVALEALPLPVLHTANVTFKVAEGAGSLTKAQIDMDEIIPVYEVKGLTSAGAELEVDIRLDGSVEELEIQVNPSDVPAAVQAAVQQFAPQFQPSQPVFVEKSIRPTLNGLSEIWYEFSGDNFDVEVRSDAGAVLIEPS